MTEHYKDNRNEDVSIEQQIVDKKLTHPRVMPEQIEFLMSKLRFEFSFIPNTTTTLCTAILELEGHTFTIATAMSACASPENFDKEIGKRIAKENVLIKADNELWRLEGYWLKRSLIDEKKLC